MVALHLIALLGLKSKKKNQRKWYALLLVTLLGFPDKKEKEIVGYGMHYS